MKKHKLFLTLVTVALIVVTLEITSPPIAVSAPPTMNQIEGAHPQGVLCIVLLIVCVVVGVIIWGLVQMCKKIPQPPPPNDGQPTNITIAFPLFRVPAVRYMQFQFDLPNLNTNQAYFAGGNVKDEAGNVYQVLCSYNLLSSSNASGPWSLDGVVTNWMGGTMANSVLTLTNQEIALYNTNGELVSAKRWAVTDGSVSNCMQPKIVMPAQVMPKRFYKLELMAQ